ncbi:MAG: O-antigen polymerase [Bacillota bacterium]
MDAILICIPCVLALLYYAVARPGLRRAGISLPTFYLAGLVIYTIGSFAVFSEGGYGGGHAVTLMAEAALFSATVGTIIGVLLFERSYPADYTSQTLRSWTLTRGEQTGLYWGLTLSAVVCLGFSVEVLRNQAISSLLADVFSVSDSKSLLQARKAITTGAEGYFAPGIVKQFRDLLVPILLSATILISTRQRLSTGQKAIVTIAGVSALTAMLLSGVRSNLFLFFIALYVAYAVAQRVYGKMSRRKKRLQILFVLAAVGLYGVLTVLLGRVDAYESRSSMTLDVLGNLADRIIVTVPRINIDTYLFWVNLGPSYGAQWLADLRGILPGAPDVTLYNVLHQYIGGSLEGNASLGLPVDVWINWGWIGVVIFPALYGIFLVYFDCKLAVMRSPIAFGTKIVFALALAKIYSPIGFVLYGGGISILLYLGLLWLRGAESSSSRRTGLLVTEQASG